MRCDSPGLRIGRRIGEDFVWNDRHPFKGGQFEQVVLGVANRDDWEFERADEFHIHREKNRHLGFGSGAHYCVGAQLARMEAAAVFLKLLEQFPNMQLLDHNAPPIFRIFSSVAEPRCASSSSSPERRIEGVTAK